MATTYWPRSAWTSTARGGATQDGGDLVGLVVHYTGAPTSYLGLSRAATARALRSIRSYHVGTRGWADIGYSVAIDGAGRVWDLRGITRVPAAHASSSHPRENWHRSAVLLLLGVDEKPPPEMVEAFRHFRTRRWLDRWPGADDLLGHRDVSGASTSCPGDPVAAVVADGALLGSGSGGSAGDDPGAGSTWTEDIVRQLPTVSRGDRGEHVATSMGLLDRRGYTPANSRKRNGQWDGIAGEGWEEATREFQAEHDVRNSVRADGTGDGIFGEGTWEHSITGES